MTFLLFLTLTLDGDRYFQCVIIEFREIKVSHTHRRILTEQQEFQLTPSIALVAPKLPFDFLIDAFLFLRLL
jgi:hypothetical protein